MDPDSTDEMVDHLVDFFDRIAPVYDTWAGGQHGRVAGRLVDLAIPSKNEHVLDVGTGTGLVAHLVAPRVSPGLVIGIDLSDNMLSIARSRRAKNVQFLGMAAEHLVFRPASFDLVTMGDHIFESRRRKAGAVLSFGPVFRPSASFGRTPCPGSRIGGPRRSKHSVYCQG